MINKDFVFDDLLDEKQRRAIYLKELGIPIEEIGDVRNEVFRDLDKSKFGVTWWITRNANEKKLSVLAADYLYQLIDSLINNLIEAKIHLNEFEQLKKTKLRNYVGALEVLKGGTKSIVERRNTISDFYREDLEDAHMIGTFRAIGSALDCLAGIHIGITGLPSSLFKTDFKGLRKYFNELNDKIDKSDIQKWQLDKTSRFFAICASSSPQGWAQWILEHRNMYTHRGRLRMGNVGTPKPTNILNTREDHMHAVEVTSHLPKYPDLSEVESYLQLENDDDSRMLGEDHEIVIKESTDAVLYISREASKLFKQVWNERKLSCEEKRIFPINQWPKVKSSQLQFEGYSKNKIKLPKELVLSPESASRLFSSALHDETKKFWDD